MKKPGENYRESPGERYLVRMKIAIVLFIIAIPLILFFCPADGFPRAPVWHASCKNNMRNFDMAVLTDSMNKRKFRAYSVDKDGKPLHSWRTLILQGVEQYALYEKIRFDEPWDSEYNRQFHDIVIPIFQCPSERDSNSPQTHYRMLVGPGSIFGDSNEIRDADVFKRIESTGEDSPILIIETSETVHWMCPDEIQYEDYMNGLVPPASLDHRYEAFLDGSVRGRSREIPFYQTIRWPEFATFFGLPAMLFIGTVVFCAVSYRKYKQALKDSDNP